MDAKLRRQMQARALMGYDPTGEQAAAYEAAAPQREAAGNALGNVGLELTGVPQLGRAASGIGEAVTDPSIPNVTNAAVQSGLAAFRPMLAVKALLAGYGAAGATDAANSFIGGANAADPAEVEKRLRAMPEAQVKALQQQLGLSADGKVGPATITAATRDETDREARAKASQESTTAIETARARAQVEAEAKLKGEGQSAQRNQVEEAKRLLMADILAGKTPQQDQSMTGQLYDKMGILTPVLAAILGGGAAKAATSKIGFSKLLTEQSGTGAKAAAKMADEYVVPALGGMELGTTLSYAPTYAEANRKDATNPEYDAWSKYRVRLPAEAKDEIALAESKLSGPSAIPRIDPSVTAARERLRDGGDRLMTMGGMALAGMSGGMLKEALPFLGKGTQAAVNATAETAGGIIPRVATGWNKEAARAATARSGAAEARSTAAASEADALRLQQSLDEARRRSGAQTGAAPSEPVQPVQPSQPAVAGSSNQGGSSVGTRADAIENTTAAPMQIQLDPQLRDMVIAALQQKVGGGGRKAITSGGEAPVGDWMRNWSGAGRAYADELLSSGTELTRGRGGNMTGAKLSEEIAARTGGSAPSVAEARDRAKNLIDDIAKTKKKTGGDSKSAFDKLTSDPKYTRFALPLAAGAGASEAARQMLIEELMRGQQ